MVKRWSAQMNAAASNSIYSFFFFGWCASCEGAYCVSDKVFLSHHKVNVILASDKATDRRRAGALHEELWSQLINLPWRMGARKRKKERNKRIEDKTERAGKKEKSWGKMDRRLPRVKGRHVWLLQAAHAGAAAAAGCVLIYLGLLSHRGRGLLQINATFPSWYVRRVAMLTILRRRQFTLTFTDC